jgi:hypothetical protein
MPGPNSSIVITDWGDTQLKHVNANYRGMETEKLVELRKTIFHLMMCSWSEGPIGGWVVNYDPEKIEEELLWRKVKLEEL